MYVILKSFHKYNRNTGLKVIWKNETEVSYNELQFQNWFSIVAHSPARLMYIGMVYSGTSS